jgi:RNA polymerase sigma-70 factor (ECF subfamily)
MERVMIGVEVRSAEGPGPVETRLVEAARSGDRRAFERLVEPHLSAALGASTLIVGREADAADALQNALLIAWQRLPQLRDDAAFPAWFRRIVINSAMRAVRGRRRLVELDPAQAAPSGALEHALDLRRLARALSHLDPRDRAVLTLRHFWDLSVADAARVMGVPEGTVKSRTHHALARLRAAYDAEDRR